MKGIPMPKKSRGQKRQAKTKKRQQRHARRSSPPSMPFLGGMPFDSAPDAPQGFRPLSMTQAMLEYAAPIMASVEDGTVQDPNDALQFGLLLWNSTLPEGSMTMFMRKEVEYLITPLEESQLHLSDEIIPPDGDDDTFLNALEQLDARIDFGEDYSDWEADFFELQERCCERYRHWLRAKGVPEALSQQFAFCLDPYLSFIYQYDAGSVLDVLPGALEEFFMDWLMRKVMVKPPEYTQWPPALRLFYRFLAEKGYLDDPEPTMSSLHAIEPNFIALVQQRS